MISQQMYVPFAYSPVPRIRKRAVRSPSGCAFSLVELVIVVVIIGIIAAIAVPRISGGSAASGEAALVANLTALRNAIDRYAAEHGGIFPGAVPDGIGGAGNSAQSFGNQLTKHSNAQGEVSLTKDSAHLLGPYLHRIPPLPVGDNRDGIDVAIDVGNSPPVVTTGSEGWVYNPTTGEIIANSDNANIANNRAYDEY